MERDHEDYIMEKFPVVNKVDEQKYGRFRTKNLILGIYEAIAEAAGTPNPYQIILDPFPSLGPHDLAARPREHQ
jgi:hypothetical protein